MPAHRHRQSRALWLAVPIILLGFALRVYRLDAVRHEFDRGYPHGLGIAILESIADRRWSDLPAVSSATSVALPNPPLLSYIWALVAVVDRSPFSATAVSAMLNVLVVAMTYALAGRLFGVRVAWPAALLAASSPWAIHTARGAWVQGWLELSATCAAWLGLTALKRGAARRLIAGALITATLIQTYLLALGVAAQVVAAIIVAGARLRALLKPAALALVILVASASLFAVANAASRSLSGIADGTGVAGFDKYPEMGPSIPNPFGIRIDYTAAVRTAAMTSGRGYDALVANDLGPDFIGAEQRLLWSARALLVEVLLAVGFGMATWRARRSVAHRWMAVWLSVPILSAVVFGMLRPKVDFLEFYFLMTQPAGYALAALPIGALISPASHTGRRKIVSAAIIGCALALALAPAPMLMRFAEGTLAQPLIRNLRFGTPTVDRLPTLPLRWQPALRAVWQQQCHMLNDAVPQNWLISMNESGHMARAGRWAAMGDSHQWLVSPQGGDCVTLADGLPVYADAFPVQLGASTAITVYRSRMWPGDSLNDTGQNARAVSDWRSLDGHVYALRAPAPPLVTNLGWSLAGIADQIRILPNTPPDGSVAEVTYVWRIDRLPDEPHAGWVFDCFAQLIDAAGNEVALARAPGLPGAVWQPGQLIVMTLRVAMPADAIHTNGSESGYTLRISLYDPQQRKNAVFFDPAWPDRPILFLEHSALAMSGANQP